MTRRKSDRTETCGRPEARVRLAQANQFIEVARIVLSDASDESMPGVAGSLAVLAGIATADAACCTKLRQRFRGQDHHGAADLVATLSPDGAAMAKDLNRLITKKAEANYASNFLSAATAKDMVTWAERLIITARRAVES